MATTTNFKMRDSVFKRKICGVYKFTFDLWRHIYIGSSNDSSGTRFDKHVINEISHKYKKDFFYNVYHKYPDNCSFQVIEECSEDMLYIREQFWLNWYRVQEWTYGEITVINLADFVKTPMRGRKHTSESKQKNSESNKKVNGTPEARQKQSERKLKLYADGWKNPMLGKKHTSEAKQKMSQITIEHFQSLETRQNMSEIQKKVQGTPEARQRNRESQLRYYANGGKNGACKQTICVEMDIIYESASDASHKTGINLGNISACCNGKLKTAGGFHWRFVEQNNEKE